jgi:hypothetical protein
LQYSKDKDNFRPLKLSNFFGNAACLLQQFTCRGIKRCEYTHPDLLSTTHTELDPYWSTTIAQYHTQAFQNNPNIPNARETEEQYRYHLREYTRPGSCLPAGLCIANQGLKLTHIRSMVSFLYLQSS